MSRLRFQSRPADHDRHRHEFYETDERLTLSVFDKGADPAQVSVKFQPRSVSHALLSRLNRSLTICGALVDLRERREEAFSGALEGSD